MPTPNDKAARILVVIPCLNEEKHLEQLVRELVANTRELDLRVVIVDGRSADKTAEIAQRLAAENPRVLYLFNIKRIQSAAINLAIAKFGDTADYLIRLDAHAVYPADFCSVLLSEEQATGAASVVVPMNTIGREPFQRAVAAAQNSKLGNGGSAHRNVTGPGRFVDHGHHALMRIDAFRAVGGYDETFSHNEDAELDIRLQQAGHKVWLTGKTALDYIPRSTPTSLFIQYMHFGQGRARNILKHALRPKLRQMLPAAVLPAAILFLLSPLVSIAALPLLIWAGL